MPYGFNDDKSKYSLEPLMTNVSNLLTDAAELEGHINDLSESCPFLWTVDVEFSGISNALVPYPDELTGADIRIVAFGYGRGTRIFADPDTSVSGGPRYRLTLSTDNLMIFQTIPTPETQRFYILLVKIQRS